MTNSFKFRILFSRIQRLRWREVEFLSHAGTCPVNESEAREQQAGKQRGKPGKHEAM